MQPIPIVLLTLLALAGIFLAAEAGVVVLVAAVVVVARRQRRNSVPAIEPAE